MTSGIDLDRVDKLLLDPSFSPPLPYLPIPHASLPTLRFTPFLSSDIPSLVRTLNDPLVFPFLIGPPYPYTLSDGQYWSDLREEQYRKWKVGGDGKTEGWTLSTIRVGREWVGTMGVERWKFEEVGDLEERRRRYEENRGKKVGEESVVWAIGCVKGAMRWPKFFRPEPTLNRMPPSRPTCPRLSISSRPTLDSLSQQSILKATPNSVKGSSIRYWLTMPLLPPDPSPSPLPASHPNSIQSIADLGPCLTTTTSPFFRQDASTSTLPPLPSSPSPRLERQPLSTERRARKSVKRTRANGCKTSGDRAGAVAGSVLFGFAPSFASATPISPFSARQYEKSRVVEHLEGGAEGLSPTRVLPDSQVVLATPVPPVVPRPYQQQQRRAIIPPWEKVEGRWQPASTWSLFGKGVTGAPAPSPTAVNHDPTPDVLMEDNLDSTSPSSTPTSTSASVLTTPTPSSTASAEHANASATSFTIPSGWTSPTRQTNYYAVPVIIATSVILASIVIISIILTVSWRRKQRRRRGSKAVDSAEKGGDRKTLKARMSGAVQGFGKKKQKKRVKKVEEAAAADGSDASSTRSGSGSGSRRREITRMSPVLGLRRRRQRPTRGSIAGSRRGGEEDDDDDDASAPLTHSVASSPLANTITGRIAARLRSSTLQHSAPSTVFSRSLERTASQTTAESAPSLSRTTSIASYHSRRSQTPLDATPDTQGQPVDQVDTLRHRTSLSGSTFGGVFGNMDSLPAPGPPAYRPNSSTVQTTQRLTQSIIPPASPLRLQPSTPAEEEWHWPNEKVQPTTGPAPPVVVESPAPEEAEELPPPPPVDRSTFAAHLATDDKEVLARLRQRDDEVAHPSGSALADASAPVVEDEDVDEEGFERFEANAEASGSSASAASLGLLPLPPQPITTSFEYTSPRTTAPRSGKAVEAHRSASESSDVDALPLYLPRPDIAEASAPPIEEDEEDDLEYAESVQSDRTSLRSAGTGRLEHRVV